MAKLLELKTLGKDKDPVTGAEVEISTQELAKSVLTAQAQISLEELFRLNKLFVKIDSAKIGDVIEIEDSDYATFQRKLEAFAKDLKGAIVGMGKVIEVIQYFKSLPDKA